MDMQNTAPAKTGVFVENVDLSEASLDNEARVIRGVTLIKAGMSLNRRFYPEDVLQKAAQYFENSKAFDNHPSAKDIKERRARSTRELTGWYANVRYENGALRGDRYFSRNQAGQDAYAIAEDIINGRAPRSLAGLSINAVGQGKVEKFEDGEALRVESITSAESVDDVVTPAAGGSYALVASDGNDLVTRILETLDYQEWFNARPEFSARLTKEVQKVRLEESTKAKLAEADTKVKAASEAAERSKQAVEQTQADNAALKEAHTKLLAELETARRELALEKVLRKAQLPALYENDLRERLSKLAESEWLNIIEREKQKAKTAVSNRVPVTGAGQQISEAAPEKPKAKQPQTLDLSKVNSPAEFERLLANYTKG